MAPRTIEQIMADQKKLRQTRGLASREAFRQARAMSFGGQPVARRGGVAPSIDRKKGRH